MTEEKKAKAEAVEQRSEDQNQRVHQSLMSSNLSVQQLLECLRELSEATPEDAPAIRAGHKLMGADDNLLKASQKHQT